MFGVTFSISTKMKLGFVFTVLEACEFWSVFFLVILILSCYFLLYAMRVDKIRSVCMTLQDTCYYINISRTYFSVPDRNNTNSFVIVYTMCSACVC